MATFTAGQVLTAAEMNQVGNDSGWLTVANGSMTNSWVNGSPAFGYRLIGNVVRLRGQVASGTSTLAVLTLPSGFRPLTAQTYPQIQNAGVGVITITTAGVVTITLSAGSSTGCAFDDITFTID